MYDELVKRVRQVAEEVCDDFDIDPYIAEQRSFVIEEAADAIEELQRRVPKAPHGRLIDADELVALVYANIALFDSTPGRLGADQKLVRAWLASMADDINDAPTIIPAEEVET